MTECIQERFSFTAHFCGKEKQKALSRAFYKLVILFGLMVRPERFELPAY